MQMVEVIHNEEDDYYSAITFCPICGCRQFLGNYDLDEEGPIEIPAEEVIDLCVKSKYQWTKAQREKHEEYEALREHQSTYKGQFKGETDPTGIQSFW